MNSYDKIKQNLDKEFKKLNLDISEYQYKQIYKYYNMLVDWNKVMNLTAITDENEFSIKHVVDSILVYNAFDLNTVESVIDVGTGAGLPGIPLKIIFPHIHITLLDSLNKRIHFLQEVVDELKLENVLTIHGRAEDFGKDENYREQYDLCVSRAVSQLAILSEYCIPFVKVDGTFIAYKSVETDLEIDESKNAITILGGEIFAIKEYDLVNDYIKRRFVLVNKTSSTDMKYPRKAGKPQKSPLK